MTSKTWRVGRTGQAPRTSTSALVGRLKKRVRMDLDGLGGFFPVLPPRVLLNQVCSYYLIQSYGLCSPCASSFIKIIRLGRA